MAIPFEYNFRNVTQRPIATLTTAVGIGLTVMIFIGALALAAGFAQTLKSTGSPNNAIVLRKGADSEISSSVSREAVDIIRANSGVAIGPEGRPLATADLVVVANKQRLGQPGSSNVTVRGVDPSGIAVRADLHVVEGRQFAPGTAEVIVGRRVAKRFANCGVGEKIKFQQREFTVGGHFDAGGSAFESEIWGDAAVLGPALDRENSFQTVTFRMKNPASFVALKKELEADPRLQVQLKLERDFYARVGAIHGADHRHLSAIMAVGRSSARRTRCTVRSAHAPAKSRCCSCWASVQLP
jgi:ABC-type lipoprotein release transport system permease subunit